MTECFDMTRAAKYLLANVKDCRSKTVPSPKSTDEHAAMMARLRKRVHQFPPETAIVLLADRTQPFASVNDFGHALLVEAAAHPHSDMISRLVLVLAFSLEGLPQEAISETHGPYCFPMPDHLSVVFPARVLESHPDRMLWGLPAPLRTEQNSADLTYLLTCHEVYGHATESVDMSYASRELRADMAGMAVTLRDCPHTSAVRMFKDLRNLSLLRSMHASATLFGKNPMEFTSGYANSVLLGEALPEMETNVLGMDDPALIAYVNDLHASLDVSRQAEEFHGQMLLAAYKMLSEAADGKTSTQDQLKQQKPKLFHKSLDYLKKCAEGLCEICQVDRAEIFRPAAPIRKRKPKTEPVPHP